MDAHDESRAHRPTFLNRPPFLNRSVRRGRSGVLPGALALAAAAALLGTYAAAAPASATPSAASPPAADLCPTGNVCLYVGGVGVPEPLQIRQCQSRKFGTPFRARKVENNTRVSAQISTAGGDTVTVPPGQAVNFAPDLRVASAGTSC
ncbi:hypothetical protein [Streptomyces albireticuli]|uniref:Peptidase inhibitor family I36 n=1 Tax=Streptomyces albireticuli TaxID=1940 RepID=A0A2A2DDB8_9ACTN|nr:hypothetical protein [Streptomyces albireticuli]MCD9144958.1 hypothetical protein [Streptomyces albireticuli]MCD9164384.1 hypothetical protein [Streptomyces albireticuli]MCD9194095.1 hypothetical protein [Streptomyces albireticuli]PAU49389.1 hypothetical protein CK936_08005 [Streptomyces albireticuli]